MIINTGSGLKDVRAAIEVAGAATSVEPNIDAIRRASFRYAASGVADG